MTAGALKKFGVAGYRETWGGTLPGYVMGGNQAGNQVPPPRRVQEWKRVVLEWDVAGSIEAKTV